MMRKLAIGFTVLAISVHGGASGAFSAVSSDALDAERVDSTHAGPQALSTWINSAAPVQVVVSAPAPAAPVSERAQSANPLWAIPLAQFPVTRDRPIFSSSRRPPPPAVAPTTVAKVAVVPKPKEPERLQLSLVGTIAGVDEGFGIFLDQSTKAVLRLKVGEEYQGWKLQSVQGRETVLQKDQQVVTLVLPPPGLEQPTNDVPPPPPTIPRLRSSESRQDRYGH
jgi:hypothetical protein